jgi:hypothetical protein
VRDCGTLSAKPGITQEFFRGSHECRVSTLRMLSIQNEWRSANAVVLPLKVKMLPEVGPVLKAFEVAAKNTPTVE